MTKMPSWLRSGSAIQNSAKIESQTKSFFSRKKVIRHNNDFETF
jgi:hypothetical protein